MRDLSTGQQTLFTTTPLLDRAWASMPTSFERALRAENKSKTTIRSYMDSLRAFYEFLVWKGMPVGIEAIRREHVETYIIWLQTHPNPRTHAPVSSSTLGKHYKILNTYFTWAVNEGEIKEHPMGKMKRPHLPENPPPVLTEDEIGKVLKACVGKDFYARRDTAIVRVLLDTGIRCSELVGIKLTDIDWKADAITVMGKGRKGRTVPFGRKTAQALDRYIRARAVYPTAHLPNLWLGHSGKPLGASGVQQLLRDRGNTAGVEGLHPHAFRRSFAQAWLRHGGTELGLMRLAGWSSRSMIGTYVAGAQTELAHIEHQNLQLGDHY